MLKYKMVNNMKHIVFFSISFFLLHVTHKGSFLLLQTGLYFLLFSILYINVSTRGIIPLSSSDHLFTNTGHYFYFLVKQIIFKTLLPFLMIMGLLFISALIHHIENHFNLVLILRQMYILVLILFTYALLDYALKERVTRKLEIIMIIILVISLVQAYSSGKVSALNFFAPYYIPTFSFVSSFIFYLPYTGVSYLLVTRKKREGDEAIE